jgi:hypothetical protein
MNPVPHTPKNSFGAHGGSAALDCAEAEVGVRAAGDCARPAGELPRDTDLRGILGCSGKHCKKFNARSWNFKIAAFGRQIEFFDFLCEKFDQS